MASIAEDPMVIARVETTVAAAADHLKVQPPELTPAALGHQLATLRQRLEQRIALPSDPTADWATTAEILIAILNLQCELLDQDLARRVKSMSEIRSALGYLRGLPPHQMIYAAPEVLSRELAFARTMISSVRGSLWLPRHMHIEEQGADPHSRQVLEYIASHQIQLAEAPLETELVRKRCGAFAPSPMDDKRTFKDIIEVSGCFGYIAAPITVQGRAIGILHVDRPEPHGIVTMDHLEQLEAFAECLSVAFESAALEEKAAQQRVEVDSLCGNVEELLGRSSRPVLWSLPTATHGPRHDVYFRRDQPDSPALTSREREIMSHVATGATNGQIARCLVISEGTVKSHLKHIAKKLNTSSRAAAVATYGGLVTA
jgi:DNA-binding CsgD family transcriptional regulator/GAF domain-containing protein